MRKEMNCPKLLRSLNWILIFIFVEVAGICNADVAVAPGVGVQLPSDTNRISFVRFSRDTAATNAAFTLYAPEPMPIDLFARDRLDDGDPRLVDKVWGLNVLYVAMAVSIITHLIITILLFH